MKEEASNSIKAPVFAIDRLRMGTDGHGVTTLVCFMECPLNCTYCLNDQCHDDIFESDGVTPCQKVMMLTPRNLYDRVKIDNIYFQATDGGICFGGGEPIQYADFIIAFKKICGESWKITIETALHGCTYRTIEQLAPVIDEWIVDVKDMDNDIYYQYTGHPPLIKQNLAYLQKLDLADKVTVKVPLIPGYNTEYDIKRSIGELRLAGFKHIETIRYVKRNSKYSHQNREL